MDLSRYPKPYGPDSIVIPMTMELPESFVAYMEAMSAIEAMPAPPPEPSPWRELSRGDPPVPVPLAPYRRAAMAEAAAAEVARRRDTQLLTGGKFVGRLLAVAAAPRLPGRRSPGPAAGIIPGSGRGRGSR